MFINELSFLFLEFNLISTVFGEFESIVAYNLFT